MKKKLTLKKGKDKRGDDKGKGKDKGGECLKKEST